MTSTATVSLLISIANASSVIFFAAAAPVAFIATEMLCSDDACDNTGGWCYAVRGQNTGIDLSFVG